MMLPTQYETLNSAASVVFFVYPAIFEEIRLRSVTHPAMFVCDR